MPPSGKLCFAHIDRGLRRFSGVPRTVQVNLRLSESEINAIDRYIVSGDFDNRTEFVRFCIRKTMARYEPGRRLEPKDRGCQADTPL